LESIYGEFGGDKRFSMISLSLDDEIAAPREFLASRTYAWNQIFLGNPSQNQVARDYNAHTIPLVILVSPEGKIVARELRGEAIKAAVSKALSAP
jgi:hypothetical protein